MAEKNLKSIQFPGLPDVYVLPEIDETLTIPGAAADAESVGNALDTIDSNMFDELERVEQYASGLRVRNLLDNSDFTNPINQRGQTSYNASGYTIDRWFYSNSNGVLTINDGFINLSAASANSHWRQTLEKALDATKSYTFAIRVKGTGTGFIGFYNSADTSGSIGGGYLNFTAGAEWKTVLCTISNTANADMLTIRCDAGASLDIEWAALYENKYTTDTLPPYVSKDYAVELAECMRYYQQYNSGDINTIGTSSAGYDYYRITLQQIMRVAPTLIESATFDTYATSSNYAGIVATMFASTPNRVVLRGTRSGAGIAVIVGANTSAVKLSADL